MAEPALATENLAFAYRTKRADLGDLGDRGGRRNATLSGIDLRVERGEVVGLLGPNGSGTSTLVRIVSGVLPGYRGSARVEGEEVRRLPPRRLAQRMAVVPQEPSFEFPFTALEIVLLGRHPHLSGLAFESEQDVAIALAAL